MEDAENVEIQNNDQEYRSENIIIRKKAAKNVKNITIRMDLHVKSHLSVCFEEQLETFV